MQRGWVVGVTLGALAIPFCPRQSVLDLYSQEAVAVTTIGPSNAWDTLERGVDDGDAKHRLTAISAIGTIGPEPQAVRLVERGLDDKDSDIRQTAAATLGQMGAHDAIERLKRALEDNNPAVSFTAAKALWDLGDVKSRDVIQEVLEGERKDAPSKMKSAMKEAKHHMRPSELAFMGAKEGAGFFFGPAGAGVSAVQEMMKENKKDSAAAGRAAAAGILAKDPDPYSLVLLEWALSDNNWAVRVAVAKALGERGNETTVAKLSPLLADDHHAVRYMAAASMVRLSLKKPNSAAGE